MNNKDKEFWQGLKEWDVMVLIETWVDKEGWKKIQSKMPKGYEWGVQEASRKNKKGRAMGGLIMGIRKELKARGTKIKTEENGLIIGQVIIENEKWKVIGAYMNENKEETLEKINSETELEEERIRR